MVIRVFGGTRGKAILKVDINAVVHRYFGRLWLQRIAGMDRSDLLLHVHAEPAWRNDIGAFCN